MIQMDTIDFGEIFAFTAIDIFSKEVDILLAPALTAEYGCKFLFRSMQRRFNGHVDLLQLMGDLSSRRSLKVRHPCFAIIIELRVLIVKTNSLTSRALAGR